MSKGFKRNLNVTVNLGEFTGENEKFDLFAYVFSRSGRLLGKKKVIADENQPDIAKIDFDLTLKDENVVVKLGPDVEIPSDLGKHAPVVEGTVLKEDKSILNFDIGKHIWHPWLRKPYYVRGNVVKIENGEELAIPYGDVDIYDIDIGFIFKLKDDIIERIREALIDVITNPPAVMHTPKVDEIFKPSWWNDDYCGTPIGPRPPIGVNVDISKLIDELPQEWSFARKRFEGLTSVRTNINKKIESMVPDEKLKWLEREVLENVKMSSLIYTNTMQFRKLLTEKFQSFRFWLCWFPWIYWMWSPYFWYNLEKLGTAKIQQDGSFSKLIWLSVKRRDIPDLWFRIRQQVNGVERSIFARHPVPCNTYWNHPSGHPVRLIVTDPNAVALHKEHDISEDEGLWVCPLAIGNHSFKRIYGTGAGNVPITNSDSRVGKYESIKTGLKGSLETFEEGPFGGFIGIRILFSGALLDENVKFYKIKYRSNGSGSWYDANHEVKRHYSHYNSTTKVLQFLPYHLGPQSKGTVSNLFEIRPKLPPNIKDEPNADWYVLDATVDLMSGYINTASLPNGYIEIKLELYNNNGVRINPPDFIKTDSNKEEIQFRLPKNLESFETIDTKLAVNVNPDLVKDDPENSAYKAFIFMLQIDNSSTTANIDPPKVISSNNTASDCGITHYVKEGPGGEPKGDSNVELSYQARHPNKYAVYSFKVIRNASNIITITGKAGDMGDTGNFKIHPLINKDEGQPELKYLLECCPDAAFSMNLDVWNMSFNGWNRVGRDASFVRAFALIHKTE